MEYDWKNLTAPLPDDIRMLKENGSWDRELAAIDKRLERELPEALRQRLLIEKEITARLRLEYTYSWEDAVRLMSEELTQFDPSELEYYQNEGTADWHFVDGKVYFQKRFFRTLLKTKPEIRGKWKHLEADPVDDQEQKMLMETIREMQEKGEAAYRIHARCTLRVEDQAFRPGEMLKVHLPLPALAQQVPEVKLLKFDTYTEAFNALLDGRGDALSTDNTEVLAWALENPGFTVGIESLGSLDTIAPAVQKGNDTVKAFIDEEIVKLAEEKFFHADFDATLKEVYGEAVDPDNLVVEGGVVEE